MERRGYRERRLDGASAERFDLALITWRAFDVRAAVNYLCLSGVGQDLVKLFVDRVSAGWTSAIDHRHPDRRRRWRQGEEYAEN